MGFLQCSILVAFLVCASATPVYHYPGGSSNCASSADGDSFKFGPLIDDGRRYYGQTFTNLPASITSFSFYMGYGTFSPLPTTPLASDQIQAAILLMDSTGSVQSGSPVWTSSVVSLVGTPSGGSAPANIINNGGNFSKITFNVGNSVTLTPSSVYMLVLYASSFSSGVYSVLTTSSLAGIASCNNVESFPPPSGTSFYTPGNNNQVMVFEIISGVCTGNNVPNINQTLTNFVNGNLTITVQLPPSASWISTTFSINNATAPQCNFVINNPYSSFATPSHCINELTLQLPWSLHNACNFSQDHSVASWVTYAAPLYVTSVSAAPSLRGVAETYSQIDILEIAIEFPTSVTVTYSPVTVYAPVNLLSEVILSAYYADTANGIVTFVASLEWPFELLYGTVISAPTGISMVNFVDATSAGACGSTLNSSCLQTFSAQIVPGTACNLTGTYVVNFQVECRGNTNNCPLVAATNPANVSFALTSSNFCSKVTDSVPVSASINVYPNSSALATQNSFLVGSTAFFVISVNSSSVTQVALTSVSIYTGATYILTNDQSFPDSIIISNATGSISTSFSVYFSSTLFNIPTDQYNNFVISATVSLSYGSKKRSVQLQYAPDAAAEAVVQLAAPSSNSAPTAAPTSAPTAAPTQTPAIADTLPTSSASMVVASCMFLSALLLAL